MLMNGTGYLMGDFLSVFFVLIILLVMIPVFIYSHGYVLKYKGKYSIKYFWIICLLFVLSMVGVVVSSNLLFFMICWEIMSIASFLLAVYENQNREAVKSGIYYFILTHISGFILMVMFSYIYKHTGTIYFSEIMDNNEMISKSGLILILALAGFGLKAGLLVSEGSSLSAVHTFPSPLSAMMSGVMLKVAIYGFIRVVFFLSEGSSWKGGLLIMIAGTLAAVYNIMQSLLQNDNKKLLAYSSSENIGVIFAVIGLALTLSDLRLYTASALALTAALLHSLNHGIFKSLLFSGAGSLYYATGTTNMNELGGIHKKMKLTALCVFIGTAAISCIPPLNGFASESIILVSFIKSAVLVENNKIFLLIILCGSAISLVAGTAIYAAVKAFGITYLGSSRSKKSEHVNKVPGQMNAGMIILAVLSLLSGILSPWIIKWISRNLSLDIHGIEFIARPFGYEITKIAVFLTGIILLLLLISKLLDKKTSVITEKTWGCGFDAVKPNMQYSADGYSQPAARYFGRIAGYKKEAMVKDTIILRQKTRDFVDRKIYWNLIKLIDKIAAKVVKIHYGKIQLYVAYILSAVIISLILVIRFV